MPGRSNVEVHKMGEKLFCKGGGCTAKLGAGVLSHILGLLPKGEKDENLLIGYDSKDDAAVYKVTDQVAMVQTLDFFPPMIEDPYLFGQIAATNALSDIFAMGGEVKTALNIVCFPETMDLNILGEIMRGGSEKVMEAGGVLAGGHSIVDDSVKYGLSVTGVVNPEKMWANNTGKVGDKLVLTKRLGVGIICTANRIGEASKEALDGAITSMTTLNKEAAYIAREYDIHACTDVTGFGLLGHLHEMMDGQLSCSIDTNKLPLLPSVLEYADEFYLTAAAQKNRNHVEKYVEFQDVAFSMEEVLFDPQTSGGLLLAVDPLDVDSMIEKMHASGIPAAIIGDILPKQEKEIFIK